MMINYLERREIVDIMSGGASGFSMRAGNDELNSIRFLVNDKPVHVAQKAEIPKPNKENAGINRNDPVKKTHQPAKEEIETASVSSQRSKDNVEEVTGYFKNLLSSVAQVGLENFSPENHGVKKYCGVKQDKRTPPQFLREFESSVLSCLDDLTKGQYFAKVFDYDSFAYALAIPFDKGYKAARKYFLEITWSSDIQSLELRKLTMSPEDLELFGCYEDEEELFESFEASMIKLYVRARDCGVKSSVDFKNLLYPKLSIKFRDQIKLKEYESLESFVAALHRHVIGSEVRADCDVMDDHKAQMFELITGKSYFTGKTASDIH